MNAMKILTAVMVTLYVKTQTDLIPVHVMRVRATLEMEQTVVS